MKGECSCEDRNSRKRKHMKKRTLTVSNFLLALTGFLFLASLATVLVLNLRPIYYFDIGYLHLESETGYSEEMIRENYDALIDYNLITDTSKELTLPDFPMSETGKIHFWEVKQIFVAVQILCIVSAVILAVALWWKFRHHDYGSLQLTSILSFVIPIGLGLIVALNWDAFFVQFHHLFFQNDYWLFDPATDPVILILPDEFFAHCVVVGLLFLLLGGILTGIIYWRLNRRLERMDKKNESGKPSAI